MTSNHLQNIESRHVVVTGGGRGIGAAVAKVFSEAGARVTVMGRNLTILEEQVAVLPQCQAVQVDVADELSVSKAFSDAVSTFGSVEVLINNAGVSESAPFLKTDSALLDRMLSVNLKGVFHCARVVLPGMLENKWGRIVNVASSAGLVGYQYVSAYCAAKHGVVGMTKALALETARKGITVNAICPGYVETDMLLKTLDNIVSKTGCSKEEAAAELVKFNPQKRFIQPLEIAEMALWLCQPGSASITGQSLALTGGEIM